VALVPGSIDSTLNCAVDGILNYMVDRVFDCLISGQIPDHAGVEHVDAEHRRAMARHFPDQFRPGSGLEG
jgi:hypothetical protein